MTLFDQFDHPPPPPKPDPPPVLVAEPKEQDDRCFACDFRINKCFTCLGYPVNRITVPVTDDCNRTCWACYRPVRIAGDTYVVDNDKMICLCADHAEYVGRHGGQADPNYSPKGDPLLVMKKLNTSQPRRANAPKPQPVLPRVVSVDDEVQEGQVVDEVAEFLRKMGRM